MLDGTLDPQVRYEAVSGWRTGLDAATLLATHYPAFYGEHVAGRTVTPSQLYGIAEAFLSLVHRDLPLDDGGELELWAPPLAQLDAHATSTDSDAEFLASLVEISAYIDQPQPVFYGLGVETSMWEESGFEPALLDVALWHLLAPTAFGLGLDIAELARAGSQFDWSEQAAQQLLALPPLPADTPIATFQALLTVPGQSWTVPAGQVLAYAVAQSENPLANVTNYEIHAIYGGEHDFSWEDLASMIPLAEEASAIEDAYTSWRHQIADDPEHELPRLAAALHAAAARATHEIEGRPKALVDILFEKEQVAA